MYKSQIYLIMKTKILMIGMVLSLMTVSCNKDDKNDTTDFTSEEAGINAKLDVQNDDVSKMMEEQLTTNDGISGKTTLAPTITFLPACATVVRNPTTGVPAVGSKITKTITFASGCQMPNGNLVNGVIIISFPYEPKAIANVITVTFDNFYHNGRKVEGTKTYTRTLSPATANTVSHPIFEMTMDLTITLPDGRVLYRKGTRKSEIIEGYATGDWKDNVYSVTGSWTTTFPNTSILTSTISSPIIVKLPCVPINNALSKGTIIFTRNNKTATLDYGNGDCDNLAIFTINGKSYDIVLGR
jgi:hypothetical protein